jgi:hypothetical protein
MSLLLPTYSLLFGVLCAPSQVGADSTCDAYFAQQKDYPDNHAIEGELDPEGIMIAGGSVIINPLGDILAGPLRGEEG